MSAITATPWTAGLCTSGTMPSMLTDEHRYRLRQLRAQRERNEAEAADLTEQIRAVVVEALDEGAVLREIADTLGVTIGRVGQISQAARQSD